RAIVARARAGFLGNSRDPRVIISLLVPLPGPVLGWNRVLLKYTRWTRELNGRSGEPHSPNKVTSRAAALANGGFLRDRIGLGPAQRNAAHSCSDLGTALGNVALGAY